MYVDLHHFCAASRSVSRIHADKSCPLFSAAFTVRSLQYAWQDSNLRAPSCARGETGDSEGWSKYWRNMATFN